MTEIYKQEAWSSYISALINFSLKRRLPDNNNNKILSILERHLTWNFLFIDLLESPNSWLEQSRSKTTSFKSRTILIIQLVESRSVLWWIMWFIFLIKQKKKIQYKLPMTCCCSLFEISSLDSIWNKKKKRDRMYEEISFASPFIINF